MTQHIGAEEISRVVEDTIRLASIPAPTFEEGERAEAVAADLEQAGFHVDRDDAGNVIAQMGDGPVSVAVVAHLDTVFPAGTHLDIRRESISDSESAQTRIVGPGVGDNSLALAAMLWLARTLSSQSLPYRLYLVADVGEEGLGDLRGARAFAAAHSNLMGAIALEGHFAGRIIHEGVGSRRFEITYTSPGGHSWQNFGAPNALHALLRGGGALTRLPLPSSPKTTLSVGIVEGGRSVNTIADRARMLVDTRSLSEDNLGSLEERIRETVTAAAAEEGVEVQMKQIGRRPAVVLPRDHWLVRAALDTAREAGLQPETAEASTDANALLAAGIPCVCIGVTRGGNAHRLDEWIAVEPIAAGLRHLLCLVASIGRRRGGNG